MLCRRVQKKGKAFSKDEARVRSLHRHLLLPRARGLEAAGPGGGKHERSDGGCWGGHTSSSKPRHPPRFAVPGGGLQAGQARGLAGWAARSLGKASPRMAQPAAVACPARGHRPVCSLQPRDLRRWGSSLGLATTGTGGLGQRRGCLLGTGGTVGTRALKDFGMRFPPSLAGTQLRWWEFVGRNPPVSARLYEGEGRGSLSPSPSPVR